MRILPPQFPLFSIRFCLAYSKLVMFGRRDHALIEFSSNNAAKEWLFEGIINKNGNV